MNVVLPASPHQLSLDTVSDSCRAESASANEFERLSPEVRGRERGETSTHRLVALGAWSRGLVSLCSPFCARILYSHFVAIYYVSLTTRTRVTPKEGAAACSLPCGVGGIGWGVGCVGNGANTSISRPARTHALHSPIRFLIQRPFNLKRI